MIDRIQAAYDQQREQVSERISQIEGFTKSKPWAALGLAVVGALVIGRLTAKPKIVYVHRVKPSDARRRC